jgi:hypothetical protein
MQSKYHFAFTFPALPLPLAIPSSTNLRIATVLDGRSSCSRLQSSTSFKNAGEARISIRIEHDSDQSSDDSFFPMALLISAGACVHPGLLYHRLDGLQPVRCHGA